MAPPLRPCGTWARYVGGCRCEPCREAGRQFRRARYADPARRASHHAAQARSRLARSVDRRAVDAKARRDRRTAVLVEVRRIKEATPCADCGVRYPYVVMDFDHRPGEGKVGNLARMATDYALPLVLAEIAKCDVVCSNCHRLRTQRRRG